MRVADSRFSPPPPPLPLPLIFCKDVIVLLTLLTLQYDPSRRRIFFVKSLALLSTYLLKLCNHLSNPFHILASIYILSKSVFQSELLRRILLYKCSSIP